MSFTLDTSSGAPVEPYLPTPMKRTRYKFLGQRVVKVDVLGTSHFRGASGPFIVTVETVGRRHFVGRLTIAIPTGFQDRFQGPSFVSHVCSSPRAALANVEVVAKAFARSASRAVKTA